MGPILGGIKLIKQATNVAGNFEGFSGSVHNDSGLFGLVIE